MSAGCWNGLSRSGDPALPSEADGLRFRYGLELRDRDGVRRVAEDFPFRSGDQFRFALTAEFPAYVYLFNRGAGERSYTQLSPAASNQPLPRGVEVRWPQEGSWYRMDQEAGIEQVVLVVATRRIAGLPPGRRDLRASAFEQHIGDLERTYRPAGLRRNRVGDAVELVAESVAEETLLVMRIPLSHE